MKIVIQRVKKASVKTVEDGKTVGKIDKGLFVLLGIKKGDDEAKADHMVEKLAKIRLMADEKGKMNLTVFDTNSEILVVSQFTLLGNTEGGNRPSFIDAEDPLKAKRLYEHFVDRLKNKGLKVSTGSFGEYMNIDAQLDGPVTIIVEI